MQAERMPLKKMAQRKAKVEERKALVDKLTGLVKGIRSKLNKTGTPRALREFSANTNEEIAGVSIDKAKAEPGNYQLEVTQLAQRSSAMTSGFADPKESYIGVGFIQYDLPNGESKEIYVDSDNATLEGVAKLINGDDDSGLSANVVNDGSGSDTPYRLILSRDKTGDMQKADFPQFYFVDGEKDFYLEFERPAHDAKVKLNGFEIEVPENKADNLIPGVTLDLKKAVPGKEFNVSVKEDVKKISGKVQGIIDELNKVISFIREQNNIDENTDTSRTLGGDIILQTLESRIRGAVFRDIQTEFGKHKLSQIGVTFQRNGSLKLDQNKFEEKLNENYEMVSQVLTGQFKEGGIKTDGAFDHIKQFVDDALQFPAGVLRSRKKSIQSNIDQIDRRIEQKERRLEDKKKTLKNKFARLEGRISKIKSQGAGLSNLGGSSGGAINQLMGG